MRMRPYFSSLAAPTSGEAPSYQESRTCQSLVEKAAFFLALEPWRPFAGLEESPFDRKAELSRAILVEERLKVLFEALVRMSFFLKENNWRGETKHETDIKQILKPNKDKTLWLTELLKVKTSLVMPFLFGQQVYLYSSLLSKLYVYLKSLFHPYRKYFNHL